MKKIVLSSAALVASLALLGAGCPTKNLNINANVNGNVNAALPPGAAHASANGQAGMENAQAKKKLAGADATTYAGLQTSVSARLSAINNLMTKLQSGLSATDQAKWVSAKTDLTAKIAAVQTDLDAMASLSASSSNWTQLHDQLNSALQDLEDTWASTAANFNFKEDTQAQGTEGEKTSTDSKTSSTEGEKTSTDSKTSDTSSTESEKASSDTNTNTVEDQAEKATGQAADEGTETHAGTTAGVQVNTNTSTESGN